MLKPYAGRSAYENVSAERAAVGSTSIPIRNYHSKLADLGEFIVCSPIPGQRHRVSGVVWKDDAMISKFYLSVRPSRLTGNLYGTIDIFHQNYYATSKY